MLTKKQQMAAELMIQYPLKNDKEIADMVGFTPSSMCRAKQRPEFQEYLHNRLLETWRDNIKVAQHTMIELAKRGDFNASKYILSSAGYDAPQKVELESNVIKITIEDDEK